MMCRPRFPFTAVLIGLCFFFNPSFAVIDFLPDFLGCLLIAWGLSDTALYCEPMRDARRGFLRVAAANAVKDLFLLFIFSAGTAAEQPTALLGVAFAAAVVEYALLFFAFRALWDGFEALSFAFDLTELYENGKSGRSRTERLSRFTLIFLAAREGLALLPEFSALSNSSYSDSGLINIYQYIGLMRGIAAVAVTIIGVTWLVRVFLYFGVMRRSASFREHCAARVVYCHKTCPGIRVERRHGAAFALVGVGAFLLTDFYLDFRNVIPDALGGTLILTGVLLFGLTPKKRLFAAIPTAVYIGIAAVSTRLTYAFRTEYSAGQISRSEEAASAYRTMWLCSFAEFLTFLALLAALLLALRAVLAKWGGYRPAHTDEAFEERARKKLREEHDGRLLGTFVFGFISGLASFLYDYMQELPQIEALRFLEFFWFADFCLALLFAVRLTLTLSAVSEEIQKRFQFDGIGETVSAHTTFVPQINEGVYRNEQSESEQAEQSEQQPKSE